MAAHADNDDNDEQNEEDATDDQTLDHARRGHKDHCNTSYDGSLMSHYVKYSIMSCYVKYSLMSHYVKYSLMSHDVKPVTVRQEGVGHSLD